jgi:exodeoxyribonuclease VII large subunit
LQEKAQRLDESRERLRRAVVLLLRQRRQRLEGSRRALLALGPLHTLERGWAIATEEPGGRLLRDAAAVAPGAKVRIRLQKGALRCSVDEALPGPGLDLRGRPA